MKLKLSQPKEIQHSDVVTSVAWNNSEEILSCGDDHVVMKCNLVTSETQKLIELPPDVFPIELHSFTRAGAKNQSLDLLLITSSDGRFHLVGKNGRIEKSVEAHKGAVLVGQWSPDGTSLFTGGEDGVVKVWSRSGMLRSTVAQSGLPVYAAYWNHDTSQILFSQGKFLIIKPLAPNSKTTRWKAHDGLILKAAWDHVNDLIVSGGEDCRYKVWDSFGRLIYASIVHEHPITALSWSPTGNLFALGSYDTLRLCDKSGWSHCLEKPSTGSLYSISWSPDGTQVAAACSNHQVLIAHVIGRKVSWGRVEAETVSKKVVVVQDSVSGRKDRLELNERVIHVGLAYGHVAAVTPTQCHLHPLNSPTTATTLDLREGSVSHILMAEKYFLLVERNSLSIYSYDGRLVSSPKPVNLNTSSLNRNHISLSSDALAIRDQNDDKVIQVFDIKGKEVGGQLGHTATICELALSQSGPSHERMIAFTDRSRDLWLAQAIPRPGLHRKIEKLGNAIQSFKWNSHQSIIAAIQETSVTVWYFPLVVFVDKSLTRQTTSAKDSSDVGRGSSISSFVGNQVGVRRWDGALVYQPISAFVPPLHQHAAKSNWKEALRIARLVNEAYMWSTLAAMATHYKNLDAAEMAYAAIDAYDKVLYIQHIKEIPVRTVQIAEMFLLGGNVLEAEAVLLQNGLVFRAVWSNINTHKWNRALEIALRHKSHVDTVLYFRKIYLDGFEKSENNEKFLQVLNQVKVNEDEVERNVAAEFEKEKDAEN